MPDLKPDVPDTSEADAAARNELLPADEQVAEAEASSLSVVMTTALCIGAGLILLAALSFSILKPR